MRDLSLHSTINILAWSSVIVVLSGCGKGNKDDDEEPSTEEAYCEAFQECEPQSFDDTYSSKRECVRELEESVQTLTDEYGRACGRAMSDLLECAERALSRTCDPESFVSRCDDELDEFGSECLGDYDYDYDYEYYDYYSYGY